MAKPIGTLGTVDTLSIGSGVDRVITNLTPTGQKKLYACVSNASVYSSLTDPDGTQYQVPSGKTFTFQKLFLRWGVATASDGDASISVGYNNIAIPMLTATAAVSPVFFCGVNNISGTPEFGLISNAVPKLSENLFLERGIEFTFIVPQLKYPMVQIQTAVGNNYICEVWGIEA